MRYWYWVMKVGLRVRQSWVQIPDLLLTHLNAKKVMLKILQARLQQYVNHKLPYVQDGFRKGRRTRADWPTSVGSSKKQDSFIKKSTSASLTMP